MHGTIRTAHSAGFLAIALFLLAGCGFHLRGAPTLPEGVSTVRIEGPTYLAQEIAVFLESAGVRVTDSRENADAILLVGRETFDQRTLSFDPNTGKEREFELAYRTTYRLQGADGRDLLPAQSVTLLRDYVFDADAVIGKSRERGVLHEEMRRDAAQQILRGLGRISR